MFIQEASMIVPLEASGANDFLPRKGSEDT